MKPQTPVLGYLRVSTEAQADDGHSLAAQERRIRDYCRFKSFPEPLLFSDDESARKLRLGQRTAGAKLLAALTPGCHVVIGKLDRAWRNAADALGMLEHWQARKITLHVLDLQVDTSTPHGKLFFTMLAGFAEWEASQISERTKAGLEQARREGKRIGAAQFGFFWRGDLLVPNPQLLCLGALLLQFRDNSVPDAMRGPVLTRLGWQTATGQVPTAQQAQWILRRLDTSAGRDALAVALRNLGLSVSSFLDVDAGGNPTVIVKVRDAAGFELDPNSIGRE
jgi:DNA invertase Pin-like site-specific DNA recombinase